MRRKIITDLSIILTVLGGFICFRWFTVSPAARIAKPYARALIRLLNDDKRFTNVVVGVWEVGSKGPIYVWGTVQKESDEAELRATVKSLHCPVGVNWRICVDTNQMDVAK